LSVKNKDMQSALKHFEDCVMNQPNHVAALNGLGMIALRTKNFPVALDYFSKAEKADQENDTVLYNLGLTLARLNRSQEAVPHLKKALVINPAKKSAAELLKQILSIPE
ncbi:MAG: tetratricopeptide repeat protein, partial [Akkermansiaceae bacterium]